MQALVVFMNSGVFVSLLFSRVCKDREFIDPETT